MIVIPVSNSRLHLTRNRDSAEKKHKREHISMKEVKFVNKEMTDFLYFSHHDLDGNQKLDGIELWKAVIGMKGFHYPGHIYTDEALNAFADGILKVEYLNNDGYIDYVEYRHTRAIPIIPKKY
ncbi:hypothetical protein CEXT_631481 [Caerostris extrusa]|uniref:Uncharacterized protein n=1 Tax=Caerostris extrusa TaxID=172846 RepID=A0AAV4RHR5_CAEEX|nr:hypothetical protein CEXT_631481 [Caerostris extrusa]